MKAFTIVFLFLVLGLSVIFMIFESDETKNFGSEIVTVYRMIYGDFDTGDFSQGQQVYFMIFAFLLSIVLLNMLIAIMGDTFNRV